MIRRIQTIAICTLLVVMAVPTAAISPARTVAPGGVPTASVAYLKLGDIKGESADSNHKDWIEIQSYSWGTSSARPGAAPPSPGTLTISKTLDKASPQLAQRCTAKQSVPEVV